MSIKEKLKQEYEAYKQRQKEKEAYKEILEKKSKPMERRAYAEEYYKQRQVKAKEKAKRDVTGEGGFLSKINQAYQGNQQARKTKYVSRGKTRQSKPRDMFGFGDYGGGLEAFGVSQPRQPRQPRTRRKSKGGYKVVKFNGNTYVQVKKSKRRRRPRTPERPAGSFLFDI